MAGCLFCAASLRHTFVDLGMSPLCERYLTAEQLNQMEPFYPLHAYLCEQCFLVQVQAYVSPEAIFTEYAYFSSYSDSWLAHAKAYAEMITARFGLDTASQVIELGSNDGYLLQYFLAKGLRVLGVEPAKNVARAAIARGVPTVTKLFGRQTARELVAEGLQADLLCGANVLAQVPDVNDFVGGIKLLLKPGGVVTVEFPHLMRLMAENQFDTIYHEHFSYFSLTAAAKVFERQGLKVFDVEELSTHGGSLRVYVRHAEDVEKKVGERVRNLLAVEQAAGFTNIEHYLSFEARVKDTKHLLLKFLNAAQVEGKSVVGYGAPAKGNTLLNYCGVRSDLIEYTVDRSPAKQGHFLPGTHIPIYHPDKIKETKPDYLLILPWNLQAEVMSQMQHIRDWGGQFVVPIPEVRVHP